MGLAEGPSTAMPSEAAGSPRLIGSSPSHRSLTVDAAPPLPPCPRRCASSQDQMQQKIPLPEKLSCFALSPTGAYCAGGTISGHVYLWEVGPRPSCVDVHSARKCLLTSAPALRPTGRFGHAVQLLGRSLPQGQRAPLHQRRPRPRIGERRHACVDMERLDVRIFPICAPAEVSDLT
jgi:hypothetical protein